jgi:hypothetical protein
MLGLYTSAALREHGFETVYCSGTRLQRSKFIDRFGAIPLYNGKFLHIYQYDFYMLKENNYLHVYYKFFFCFCSIFYLARRSTRQLFSKNRKICYLTISCVFFVFFSHIFNFLPYRKQAL